MEQEQPRRRGRPPKPPGAALSERITIRLTRAEADTLDRVAQRHRVATAAVLQGLVRRSLASFRTQ